MFLPSRVEITLMENAFRPVDYSMTNSTFNAVARAMHWNTPLRPSEE